MGLLKSTSMINKSDGSNPIIISPSGDIDKLKSNEVPKDVTTVIGDKVSERLYELVNGKVITYSATDDTFIHTLGNENKSTKSTDKLINLVGNANNNPVNTTKVVKIIDQKGILTDTDGVGVDKVVTYPKYDDTKVKINGNSTNILKNIISSDNDIRKVDGNTSNLSTSALSESELISSYEKTLSKVIGYSSGELNTTDLTNAMTRLADEASKIVKISGSEDVRNYLRTTLNAVGTLTTPALMRLSGVSEVVGLLKSYGGTISNLTNEFNTSNLHTLINSALTRAYVKKVNINLKGQGANYKGYGIATNRSTVNGFLSNLSTGLVSLTELDMDYYSYVNTQNEYLNKHFNGKSYGVLSTKSLGTDGSTIYNQGVPSYNSELSTNNLSKKDRRDLINLGRDSEGLFVAYDQALWDFSIAPYNSGDGSNPPPESPFKEFFPAVDVSIDDIDTSNSSAIQLPWDKTFNLPGDKNIPSTITVRIYENQYMIVDQWLHSIMDHIYSPDGQGAYRLANFKDSSYLIKYYFLDPQLRAIKRLQYLVIPEFNFRYIGSESSALQDYSINFTVVGTDHY